MLPNKVKIVEVGPRDGLQNEKTILTVEQKVQLIDMLREAGCHNIEVGSFVSPKWVPQMSNTSEVYQKVHKDPNIHYSALVPNQQGFEAACGSGCHEISIFAAASETFSKKNINCSIKNSLDKFKAICEQAQQKNIKVRGYVSCIAGCPYEGEVDINQINYVAKSLYHMGCYEVSLGDTIGVGTPKVCQNIIHSVSKNVPLNNIAIHFHDTYGQALANIYACLEIGVQIVDSSIGGLGGCPYAKGASGNVATEDVVYMLNGLDIQTNLRINKLIKTTHFLEDLLGKKLPSKLSKTQH